LLKCSSRRTVGSATGPRLRPNWTASSGIDSDHGFDLEEIAQAEFAVFAAVAGGLEASKGGLHVARGAVQGDLAGTNPAAHAPRADAVLRPDVGGEAVGRVIGNLYRLILGLVGQDAQYGAEDLLACNGHVVAHIGENRRLDEIALGQSVRPAGAAGDEMRPFGDAL